MAHTLGTFPSLVFGTDGIRGNATQFPFTPRALYQLGRVLGIFCERTFSGHARVLIGCDTRSSASHIKKYLLAGLHTHHIVTRDLGIIPTAGVLATLDSTPSYDMGIMITASHNPPQDNGIKLFERSVGKLGPQHEALISMLFGTIDTNHDFEHLPLTSTPIHAIAPSAYCTTLLETFPVTMLAGVHVVLDCAHGAAYRIAPEIMQTLGARVSSIGVMPNGTNINSECGALMPRALEQAVRDTQADIGFAFDGDADRVIVVSKQGAVCDGDDLLALLSEHPHYAKQPGIVGTIMTNHGLALHFAKQGKELIRTPVGDAHVLAALTERNWLLGGEPSGHILMTDYQRTADGIFVALRLLEHIRATGNWDLVSFERFPQTLLSIPARQRIDLTSGMCAEIIARYTQQLAGGRIVVRYSGTEPILRIMTEGPSVSSTETIAKVLAQELYDYISTHPQPANRPPYATPQQSQ